MSPSKRHLSIGVLAALVAVTSTEHAEAEPSSSAIVADSPPLGLISALLYARLIGAHGGGGGGRALIQPSGLYVGLDAGAALMLAEGDGSTRGAAAFGLHLGYRLPSGLAFDLRGDDLGVSAPDGGGPLIAGGFGMRYTVPLEVMPFAEAHLGALDYGPHVSLAGDAALGIALPVGDHLEIDFSARDWIAEVDGAIRHIPMFALGLEVGFDRGR